MDGDRLIDEELIIKNKPLRCLPPTNILDKQISSNKDQNTEESVDKISKEIEKYIVVNNRYHNKKLPISFISPKDWQKYLNFTNSISNKSNKNSLKKSRGKNSRIFRLLNSFHKLYEEYSELFVNSTQCVQNYGDSYKSSQQCQNTVHQTVSNSLQTESTPISFDSTDESLTDVAVQTIITLHISDFTKSKDFSQNQLSIDEYEKISSNSYEHSPWGFKSIIKPAKKLGRKFKKITQINGRPKLTVKNLKTFDKIEKLENDIMLEVIEEVHQQSIVCHSLSLINLDSNKFNLPKEKSIEIPLAIELLLPKIQMKIENILNECPFLCDPLEVAAELRHLCYDQNACIKYFKITKGLRSVIKEMMPRVKEDLNGIENVKLLLPKRQSSIKSINSQIISNLSVETIKDYNASVNQCIGDNGLKDMNISTNKTYTPVNEFSSFSENSIPTIKESNSFTIDCITQTNLIHFYMEGKNIESIFHKIKNYLAVIRQLHIETKNEIDYLRKQLSCVFTYLKNHMTLLISQNNEKSFSDEQKTKMVTLSRQVEELKLKLKKEEKKRRHAYNLMQEQMGNIRVYCRCRHVEDGGNILEFVGNETITLAIAPHERFEFDKVFHPGMSQLELYEEFRPLVMSFIDGYNVCFITYGGEASGKTFTLIGGYEGSNQQGLMQRALTTILTEERLRQRDCEYKITACVVEIYNDNCIDVLSGESNIQLYVDNGMETAYQKLKSVPITNEADAEALMQVCKVKRKVARTALNPASSRSHLITFIRLQGRSKIHGENICSFLCLCDLAGFEDIIKAETQTNKVLSKEAGYINRSLTAFNRVFVSLRKQDPNTVSYRDTKLTHLLKPFLTNSGKCALIITVRNDKRSLGSTQNTLRFGRETRGVSLGKARRQVNLNGQVSVM